MTDPALPAETAVLDFRTRIRDRAWFERPTLDVARALLGCMLVAGDGETLTAGRIVETEGYLGPDDPASHSAMYRTERVAIMSGAAGYTYVYRSYGVHAMMNIVAKPVGATGAVLIRALEPVSGFTLMAERRRNPDPRSWCSGPGKLCQALGVTLDDQGVDLITGDRFRILAGPAPEAISHGPRVGISRAVEDPYRFWISGNRHVSAHQRGVPWRGDRTPDSA